MRVFGKKDLYKIVPNNMSLRKKIKTGIEINRDSKEIHETDYHDNMKYMKYQQDYSAFLGVINILDQSFLLMVDDVTSICTINKHKIFKVEQCSFIPFDPIEQLAI
jgi:hypothetical protein